jgi:hypothetical protein
MSVIIVFNDLRQQAVMLFFFTKDTTLISVPKFKLLALALKVIFINVYPK